MNWNIFVGVFLTLSAVVVAISIATAAVLIASHYLSLVAGLIVMVFLVILTVATIAGLSGD